MSSSTSSVPEHKPNSCGNIYCGICPQLGFTWNKKVILHKECIVKGCSICWQIKRDRYWTSRCYDSNYESIDNDSLYSHWSNR